MSELERVRTPRDVWVKVATEWVDVSPVDTSQAVDVTSQS